MLTLRVDGEMELALLQKSDAGKLFALVEASREHLREWLAWVDSTRQLPDVEAFIASALEQFSLGREMHCGIWYRGQLAGTVGLVRIDPWMRQAELGYWVGRRFEGRGIAKRAARALVAHAFRRLGLKRVEIRCAAGNTRSQAIPEALGFKREGVLRQVYRLRDHYHDMIVYGMLAEEWDGAGSPRPT